ncbi:radical SAM protein [Butyrivibrio sp. INlla21]|uniref:radical SAM protein n=1 Tax=Butyrivibrio sp. INlla21 TaxID=1520811 RepID=UPI0008E25A0B|nr:radical SAM protein [Butyrivibrio sp. INlla21]SFU65740.1 Radical SAM superfamily protein [Butyrivibrio sp. INlla21]
MKNAIFYGAGNWLRDNWDDICGKYNPLCICDKAPSKIGQKINNVEILSLENAMRLYPNANYLVTLKGGKGYKFEAMDSLIKDHGISKDRILNYEDYYYGYGCPLMQSALIFQHDRIQNCCENMIFSNVPHADYSDNNCIEDIYSMKKMAQEQISILDEIEGKLDKDALLFEMKDGRWAYNPELKDTKTTNSGLHCLHCESAEKWWWSKEKFTIDYLQVTANSDSFCNFKCCYCCEGMQEYIPGNRASVSDKIVKVISEIKNSNDKIVMADKVVLDVASGEPALYKGLEKVTSVLPDAYFHILTNASVYSETIQKLITDGKGEILVSLDAGTKNTFKEVKGVDIFETVYKNLEKYRGFGKVTLKYIMLPGLNDNENDIDGFLDICKKINPEKVYIARDCIYDYDLYNVNYEEKTIKMLKMLVDGVKSIGIKHELLYYPESFIEEHL